MEIVQDFERFEKDITRYALDRVNTYFGSESYKKLLNRVKVLNDSNNMKFGNGKEFSRGANEWMSKVAFPLVLSARRLREAALNAIFRVDPLITLSPLSNTPIENAATMQEVLSANIKATKFKTKILKPYVFKSLAYYGNSIVKTYFDTTVEEYWQTQNSPIGPQRVNVQKERKNSVSRFIRLLNYFQNPFVVDPDDSDYQGSIEWVTLDYLMRQAGTGNYIEKNLKAVIEDVKKNFIESEHYDPTIPRDTQRYTLDLTCMYCRFYIEGNEFPERDYYLEICRDKIIRIEENQNDYNIRPYSVFRMDNRLDHWWANTDSELVLPHENYMNLLGSIMADSALSSSLRLKFYKKGSLDIADINNRHKNGGWIPYSSEPGERFENLISQLQFQDNSKQDYDQILREIKESKEGLSSNFDTMRKGSSSGMSNKTATAANLVAQQNDILESSIMESVSAGLIDFGYKSTVILQQHLSDVFMLRPDIKYPEKQVWKEEILGNFAYETSSALEKNSIQEVDDLLNKATQLMNMRNAAPNEMQALNLIKVIREAIRKMKIGDVDDILPENPPQQQVAPLGGMPPGMQSQPQNMGAQNVAMAS